MIISICIATYNGEKYIEEQIKSIIPQLKEEDEIIISDDHSIDNTIQIIKSLKDNRIKVYLNPLERGYTKNFEHALNKAQGDVIFLCDQDDIWHHNKINKSLRLLEIYDFIVSDCTLVDENLRVLYSSHFKLRNVKKGFLQNLLFPRYVGSCMAFKRKVLIKSLPFPKNQKLVAHDYWISLIAELHFNVALLNEPLMQYRRHNSNTSNGGFKSTNSLKHKIFVRIYTLIKLLIC